MEHVVFFTANGAAQFRRTQSLEEAVRVVEHLRNVEGVDDTRVYALSEVALAFKTVYRVEVQSPAPAAQAPAAPAAPAPLPPLPPMPAMPELLNDAEAPAAPAPAERAPEPAVAFAPEPAAETPVPVPAPLESPEPVLAAVPSEPYEAAPEQPSNGKSRGMGFFAR